MAQFHNRVLELSVVIPVHNEAENIVLLITEIRKALDNLLDYELIYVDDGSTDETYSRLLEVAADFRRLRIIRHKERYGQSTALWTAVGAARAKWIATLDGDGQNDPSDIPRLLSLIQGRECPALLTLICGHRFKRNDKWIKRISSRIANTVRSSLLKDCTPDTGCGLKVFSKEAFLRLPYFDHMHRFLPALIIREGGEVRSVKVNHRPRLKGKSHYGIRNRLWVGIVDLLGVMWLQRRVKHPSIVEEDKIGN
jgi:dolichol-phosphate mannosyltransferase